VRPSLAKPDRSLTSPSQQLERRAGPQPYVNLGTAGNFVILAQSGISTVPNSAIGGDIGVSPIDSTAITGFSLTRSNDGTFGAHRSSYSALSRSHGPIATSTQVTGRVLAADFNAPTPGALTQAVADAGAAYNDVAGRVPPDFTELQGGNFAAPATLLPVRLPSSPLARPLTDFVSLRASTNGRPM
jgi:hypothetical protein